MEHIWDLNSFTIYSIWATLKLSKPISTLHPLFSQSICLQNTNERISLDYMHDIKDTRLLKHRAQVISGNKCVVSALDDDSFRPRVSYTDIDLHAYFDVVRSTN